MNGGHAQQSTDKLPVAFFMLFRGWAGMGRGVFTGSLGPSWQSPPLKPGQHLHSNCVTVLYLVTYLGLTFTRYLPERTVASFLTDCCCRHPWLSWRWTWVKKIWVPQCPACWPGWLDYRRDWWSPQSSTDALGVSQNQTDPLPPSLWSTCTQLPSH